MCNYLSLNPFETKSKTHTRNRKIDGEYAIGLFSLKDIPAGTELTYDYKFKSFGTMQNCFCGAPTCRSLIADASDVPAEALGGDRKASYVRRRVRFLSPLYYLHQTDTSEHKH